MALPHATRQLQLQRGTFPRSQVCRLPALSHILSASLCYGNSCLWEVVQAGASAGGPPQERVVPRAPGHCAWQPPGGHAGILRLGWVSHSTPRGRPLPAMWTQARCGATSLAFKAGRDTSSQPGDVGPGCCCAYPLEPPAQQAFASAPVHAPAGKDAGRLAAAWALYKAQEELVAVSARCCEAGRLTGRPHGPQPQPQALPCSV